MKNFLTRAMLALSSAAAIVAASCSGDPAFAQVINPSQPATGVPVAGTGISVAGQTVSVNYGTVASTSLQGNALHAPTAIGDTTPNTAAFTTLSATGAVSGAGFSSLFASPFAIGSTAPNTGAFTTLSATGAVSGAGITSLFASPLAIGSTTPNTGVFTTLTTNTSLQVNGTAVGAATTIANVAALRAQTCTVGAVYLSRGYASNGDGGSASYVCVSGVSTDNGCDTINASSANHYTIQAASGISVLQCGAKSDGATDDSAAINAAIAYSQTLGNVTYLPNIGNFYKVTSAIKLGSSARLVGATPNASIIRNTAGGNVFQADSTGSLGPYYLEYLRIGGAGGTGITTTPTSFNGTIVGTALTVNSGLVGGIEIGGTVTGAGVSAGTTIVSGSGTSWVVSASQNVGPITMTMANQYLVHLNLSHVQFESDLLTGINGNLIFANIRDSGFGFYTQTATNANFQAIVSQGNGVLNSNDNTIVDAQFYNSKATTAILLASGLNWRFENVDWENNIRNLSTNNVSSILVNNCYTERVQASSGQAFDFGLASSMIFVKGGIFNGGTLAAGVSMFGVTPTAPIEINGANISTSASGFSYINSSTLAHSPPVSGLHHLMNNRYSGNASDPMLWLDNVYENAPVAFTPTPTSLTVVNGTGGATYSGSWSISNRVVTLVYKITTTGTATTASTAATTFFSMPANMPLPQISCTGSAVNEATAASLGAGYWYSGNGRVFTPTWTAQNGNIVFSFSCPI
jgi:hypothetical protein